MQNSKFMKMLLDYCPSKHDTLTNVVSTLGHRLRRWPNIETTLAFRVSWGVSSC